MLYYYFGSKDGLFRAVLEGAYAASAPPRRRCQLLDVDAAEGVRRLVEFTWSYYLAQSRVPDAAATARTCTARAT
jgi:AcrR family transcriptional regulator